MKFTLSWLKEHLQTEATVEAIAETLTAIGLEIESVTALSAGLEPFTVAEILATEPHPDADKLQVCRVATHTGERQIVCGAPNARAGIKVILADIGDVIPTNGMKIKPAKIRGVESAGMLCSAQELGLGDDHAGIMELPQDVAVGDKAIDALHLNDTLFDIAITPNRGDCLGVYGVARDLAAAGFGTLITTSAPELPSGTSVPVTLDTPDCAHFVACSIQGVKNAESPDWLQQCLLSVGLRPISTLVDITNYFTITYGRPLHVYDADRLSGGITVRPSQKGEMLDALNDKTYTLPEGLCVIADDADVLGLGGVIGGVPSGCTETTTNVILEAAWFDPVAIARTGQALMIDSDARHRFERSVDPTGTEPYAAMAAQMIVELCGGTLEGTTIAGAAPSLSRDIAYTPSTVQAMLGLDVPEDTQRQLLESLGCTVTSDWQVNTPNWRPDIEGVADLVEEIARLHGYDTIPEIPLTTADIRKAELSAEEKTANILRARGIDEAIHFAFTAESFAQAFANDAPLIQVKNPISSELSVMRPHLMADLLPALQRNQHRGHKDISLFEIGAVFHGITPDQQPVRAAGIRAGATPMHWHEPSKAYDLYDAKADLMAVLETLGIATDALMINREVPGWYHPGKSARLSLGPKTTLGYFGELHPAVLRQFDVEGSVCGFECWLDQLPTKKKAKRPAAYRAREFQASRRDFAFITDTGLDAGTLRQALLKSDKTLIRDVTLFDVYEGKHMEPGKKSLAYAVTLQADDRTLSEEDITGVSDAIIAAAEKQGAVLR